MFSFLDRLKGSRGIVSTIVFDEDYCHSDGRESGAQKYEINGGTTEIVFVFPDYDAFMRMYLFDNPYLAEDVKHSLSQNEGLFCAQVVDDGAYLCQERVGADGRLRLRSQSLTPLNTDKKLREFTGGAIAFGVFRPRLVQFDVLWATMYQTKTGAGS